MLIDCRGGGGRGKFTRTANIYDLSTTDRVRGGGRKGQKKEGRARIGGKRKEEDTPPPV